MNDIEAWVEIFKATRAVSNSNWSNEEIASRTNIAYDTMKLKTAPNQVDNIEKRGSDEENTNTI